MNHLLKLNHSNSNSQQKTTMSDYLTMVTDNKLRKTLIAVLSLRLDIEYVEYIHRRRKLNVFCKLYMAPRYKLRDNQ